MPEEKPNPNPQIAPVHIPPDSAVVLNGYLLPGTNLVRAVMNYLKNQIKSDTDLAERWQNEPAAVLAERGIVAPYHNAVLETEGIAAMEYSSPSVLLDYPCLISYIPCTIY
jgi:hypothetical protein